MPAVRKTKSTTSSVKVEDSERIQLAKTLRDLTSTQVAFLEAVEGFKTWTSDKVSEFDALIEEKKDQLKVLGDQLKVNEKENAIKISQFIREKEHEAAVEFLEKAGEVAIPKEKYEALLAAVAASEQARSTELDKLKAECTADKKAAISTITKQLELEHKAAFATAEATANQLREQIKLYEQTISSLREEVDKQRQLTKSVADASAKGQITQTFDKR